MQELDWLLILATLLILIHIYLSSTSVKPMPLNAVDSAYDLMYIREISLNPINSLILFVG